MFIHGISSLSPIEKQKAIFFNSVILIQIFYITTAIFLMHKFYMWNEYAVKPQVVSSWPSDWIWFFQQEQYLVVTMIVLIGITSNLITAIDPFRFLPRFISFLTVQIYVSYGIAVSGYNNHSYYGYALIGLVFIFLPVKKKSNKSQLSFRQTVIMCMWFAAAALATIYFLIGIGNIHGGIIQILENKISVFSPKSVAYFILYELQTYSKKSILSDLILKYYFIFWIGLFIVLFKKITAPLFLFRTKYLPWLGAGLVIFHIFNALAFNLAFRDLTFQVFVFMCLNPIKYCNRVLSSNTLIIFKRKM